MTNQQGGTSYEQVHLPYGAALNAESTLQNNNKRFTSYDRSSATGLDYAINRTYDSKQGRFTTVDPIGMQAVSLVSPQTLNMYTYCGNDPVNYTDPSGLFFGALFKWIWKTIKIIVAAVLAAIAVLAFSMGLVFEGVHLALVSAQLFADTLGLKSLQKIISIASIAVSITRIRLMGVSTVPTFPLQGSGSGIDLRVLSFLGSVGSIASGFQSRRRSQKRDDGSDDNENQAWGRAFRDALELLKNPGCSQYITSNDATSSLGIAADPSQTLLNLKNDGLIRDADSYYVDGTGAASTEQFFQGSPGRVVRTGRVRLGRVFYDNAKIGKLFEDVGFSTPREARALIFLHELKHVLGGVHRGKLEEQQWFENLRKKCVSRLNLSRR